MQYIMQDFATQSDMGKRRTLRWHGSIAHWTARWFEARSTVSMRDCRTGKERRVAVARAPCTSPPSASGAVDPRICRGSWASCGDFRQATLLRGASPPCLFDRGEATLLLLHSERATTLSGRRRASHWRTETCAPGCWGRHGFPRFRNPHLSHFISRICLAEFPESP